MPSFSTGQQMACAGDGSIMVTIANRGAVQQVAQSGAPWAMTIASLPLPTGAATDASLSALGTTLAKISATLSTPPVSAGAALAVNQPALHTDGGALAHVTNFQAVQKVLEPSIRGVASLGTAGASGVLISVAIAGGATITFADGSTMKAFFPAGTTYLRGVVTSVAPGIIGALTALTLADAKATLES